LHIEKIIPNDNCICYSYVSCQMEEHYWNIESQIYYSSLPSTVVVNLKITWGHCPPSHEDNLMKATTSPFFNLTTNLAIKIVVQFFFCDTKTIISTLLTHHVSHPIIWQDLTPYGCRLSTQALSTSVSPQ